MNSCQLTNTGACKQIANAWAWWETVALRGLLLKGFGITAESRCHKVSINCACERSSKWLHCMNADIHKLQEWYTNPHAWLLVTWSSSPDWVLPEEVAEVRKLNTMACWFRDWVQVCSPCTDRSTLAIKGIHNLIISGCSSVIEAVESVLCETIPLGII